MWGDTGVKRKLNRCSPFSLLSVISASLFNTNKPLMLFWAAHEFLCTEEVSVGPLFA